MSIVNSDAKVAIDEILRIVPPPRGEQSARDALGKLNLDELLQLRAELQDVETRAQEIDAADAGRSARIENSPRMQAVRLRGERALQRLHDLSPIPVAAAKPGNASGSGALPAIATPTSAAMEGVIKTALKQLSTDHDMGADSPMKRLLFNEEAPVDRFSKQAHYADALLHLILSTDDVCRALPALEAEAVHMLRQRTLTDKDLAPFISLSLRTLASVVFTASLAKASSNINDTGTFEAITAPKFGHRAFRNLAFHAPEFLGDQVTTTQAVNGLASIHSSLRDYRPDALIAIAGGGEIIGQFLMNALGIPAKSYFVARCEEDRVYIGGAHHHQYRRMVIVDDISRTGGTLVKVRDAATQIIGSDNVQTLALVCSAEAVSHLNAALLIMPLVAALSNVRLPWNTRGSYHVTHDEYVFGFGESKAESLPTTKCLSIPKRFYAQVFDEILRRSE